MTEPRHPTTPQLGELVREYRADIRQIQRQGRWLLALGLAGLAAGTLVLVAVINTAGSEGIVTAGLLLGFGALAAGVGGWASVRARRARGESFAVHRDGLVRHATGGTTAVPWGEITRVTAAAGDGLPLAAVRGAGFCCHITTRGGGWIRIDSLTVDAEQLADAVYRAAHLGQPPPAPDGR